MIVVLINPLQFEYDIHALFKSFYPTEDIKTIEDANKLDTENISMFSVLYSNEKVFFYAPGNALIGEDNLPSDNDRALSKNIVKRMVYKALSEYTGKTLAWGDLSGIRPTKIARKLLDTGMDINEAVNTMKDTYLVSDEKTRLAIDIANLERKILAPIYKRNGYSIYIGIPFCPTTCLYCSFTSNSISMWKNRVNDYLSALEKEIEYVGISHKGEIIDTLYIGGGTPTTLSADELERLLSYIETHLDLSTLLEYTVEAGRADSITIEKLKVLKRHNVTRISVNPQTMNQKTLDMIGRRHTTDDVVRAFYEARTAGFNNINMDTILGLPEEGEAEVIKTMEEIKKLAPDSLTVHSLAIKRASRLSEWIEEKGYSTMINTDATMKIAEDAAYSMDMKPYYLYRQKNMAGNFENTGYAKEGCFGIYNILIMEEVQSIVALGAGTVTKRVYPDESAKRCDTMKDVDLYISNIDEMINRKRILFEK